MLQNYLIIKYLDLFYLFNVIYIYIYTNSQNSEKIQLEFNWILNFVSCVSFNF